MATKKPKQEGIPVPTVVIVAIVLFVAGLLIGKFTLTTKVECEEADCPKEIVRYRIHPRGNNPSIGPENAKVTIVNVTDFMNPRAKEVSDMLLKLQRKYAKVMRVVLVNNPGSADARTAAIASLAANKQGKFWDMHDRLYSHRGKLTEQALEQMAKAAGLNVEKFKEDMQERRLSSLVAFDQRQVKRLGVTRTPSIFVNGRYMEEKPSMAELEKIVKEEIKAADELLAEMAARGPDGPPGATQNIYREFMRTARTSLTDEGPEHAPDRKKPDPRARPQEDPTAVYRVPIEGKPWKGARNALITIVEFSTYTCPFCSRVQPTLKQIMDEYKGQVKIVYHHNPMVQNQASLLSAIAGIEVFNQRGNDAFWKYNEFLYADQGKLRTEARQFIEAAAENAGGINMGRLRKALDEQHHKDVIDEHGKLATALGARGSPTFFINGRKLRGARPFEAFKQVIDEELKKAEAAIKERKATKANYYDHILKTGLTQVKYLPGAAPDQPKPKQPRKIMDPDVVYKMPIDGKPWKGAEHALVTMVVSNSFQCGFSGRVAKTLDQIIEEYGKHVKLVYHHNALPFQKQAMLAAEASHEAFVQKGNDGFWAYHDKLYANMAEIRKGREFLEQVAEEVDLDMAKFKKALDENTHRKLMEEQRDYAVQLGARGTPATFVNGKLVTGARPYEAFKQTVEQAMNEAKPLVSKAGGLRKLYDFLIRDGKTSPVYKIIGEDGQEPPRRPSVKDRRGLGKGVRPDIKIKPRLPQKAPPPPQ